MAASVEGASNPALYDEDLVNSIVQQYHGEILAMGSSDSNDRGKAHQITAEPTRVYTKERRPSQTIRDALKLVPKEVMRKHHLGGGRSPIPNGIIGLDVLDLGCGSGRDSYIAASLVGPTGSVMGIDMNDAQLAIARRHAVEYCTNTLRYPRCNVTFVKGAIENPEQAGIRRDSKDLIISNCVVNRSPNKHSVLQSAYNMLRDGGEMYFCDVYCDRRLPEYIRNHEVLAGEYIAGAMFVGDFFRLCSRIGFSEPRVLEKTEMQVTDPALKQLVGNATFYSITIRLFKVRSTVQTFVLYTGTIQGMEERYEFDDRFSFPKNQPVLVDHNTMLLLTESWLSDHFEIVGGKRLDRLLNDSVPRFSSTAPPLALKKLEPSSSSHTFSSGSCREPAPK